MNLPAMLSALGHLIRDTFRQSLANRLVWLTLAVSALCILLCLSVRVEGGKSLRVPGEAELFGPDDKPLTGPNPNPGRLTLGFGAIRVAEFRDDEGEVHFLQVLLARWVAGAGGLILALIWTAGFLPEALQPGAASVLLAKPVARWVLLLGKYLGVLAFVAFQAGLFVGGTWVALGLRTGHWQSGYLWCFPILLLHFAIIYSFSALLAVSTRSTVACVFGSILCWIACFAMNHARHAAVALPTLAGTTASQAPAARWLVEAGYWILPKPADLLVLLDDSVKAGEHFASFAWLEAVRRQGAFHPAASIAASALFAVALLAIAARQFEDTDY